MNRTAAFLLAILTLDPLGPDAAAHWEMFHSDPSHTAYIELDIDPATLSRGWERVVGSGAALHVAVASDDFLTVAEVAGAAPQLLVLDGATGSTAWWTAFPGVARLEPPSSTFSMIYAVTADPGGSGLLHAFDEPNGGPAILELPIATGSLASLSPTLYLGDVYVATEAGLYSFDRVTGAQNWFTPLPGNARWAASGGGIILGYLGPSCTGCGDAGLYSLERSSGAVLAIIPDPGFVAPGPLEDLGSATLGASGGATVVNGGRLVSFDIAGGLIRYEVQGGFSGQPSLAGGLLYVVREGILEVRDEASGALQWSWSAPPLAAGQVQRLVGSAVLANTHAIVRTAGNLYLVNLASRTHDFSYPAAGHVILGEGAIYVTDDGSGPVRGRVTAISLLGGCLTIEPSALPPGRVGAAYSAALSVVGGTAPYAFASLGPLPPGLALTSAGVLSGAPTAPGTFDLTLEATDAAGCSATRYYALVVDADGAVAAGMGLASANPSRVRVFTAGGAPTPVDFAAYGAGQWGVNVATADLDGAGFSEHLTGAGPGAVYGPQVRAFQRDGTPVAKINYFAYGTLRYGVNVTSGSVDADGFEEIGTGPGPGEVFGPHWRGWNFDGATLGAIAKINFFAFGTLKYGVNPSSGSVDDDAFAEIFAGAGPGAIFAPTVRGFDYDGATLTAIAKINFNAYPTGQYGVNVSSGEMDGDAYDDIATGPGPGATFPARLLGFQFDATTVAALPGFDATPFPSGYGARVGTAALVAGGPEHALGAAGPDPSADSRVVAFAYAAGALSLESNSFLAFPGARYGSNVAGGDLGY